MIQYPCPDCGHDGPHIVLLEQQLTDGRSVVTVICRCGLFFGLREEVTP